MSWRLHHEWTDETDIVGLRLSTCRACHLMRAADDKRGTAYRDAGASSEWVPKERPCVTSATDEARLPRAGRVQERRFRKGKHVPLTEEQRSELLDRLGPDEVG